MRRNTLLLLVVSFAAACGAESPVSLPAMSAGAQGHPLEIGGTEERAGWALVSNDADALSIGLVANPGFSIAGASVCLSTEPFGWVDPASCPVKVSAGAASGQSQILVPLDGIAPVDELCDRPLWMQVWVPAVRDGVTMSTYAGAFKARIAYALACAPAAAQDGCVREAKAWAKRGSEMPIDGLVLGNARYSRTDLLEMLESSNGNDASVALGRELAAAKLNALNAERRAWIDDAIADADAWLAMNGDRLPYGLKGTEDGAANPAPWDAAMNLAAILERYNAATLGNERCAD